MSQRSKTGAKHEPKQGERPAKKVKHTSRGSWTSKPQRGFMCGITWDYEIGNTDIKVFPTLAALKASFGSNRRDLNAEENERVAQEHFKQCGYVEVKITPVRRVHGTV